MYVLFRLLRMYPLKEMSILLSAVYLRSYSFLETHNEEERAVL